MAREILLLPQHESFCECIFVRAHALLMQYSTALKRANLILFSTIITIKVLGEYIYFFLVGGGGGIPTNTPSR